jgi:hypothetical protein
MRLSGKAKRRTVGRGKKRTVGKPTKRTTNYKKELPNKNEKPDSLQKDNRASFVKAKNREPILNDVVRQTSEVCKELSSTWPKEQFDPVRFYGNNFDNHGPEAISHALKKLLARGTRIENPWEYASAMLKSVKQTRHSIEEDAE